MIVPDKTTETFLNKPVSSKEILRLCRAGVLPSNDFLRAMSLCRSDKRWIKFIFRLLYFFVGLSFLSAVVFFLISEWAFFYQAKGFVFLTILLLVSVCLRRFFVFMDYIVAVLIGFMTFLPNMVFRTNSFLYEQCFLWFVLLLVWTGFTKRSGLRIFTFFILNVTICLYGIQFALPSLLYSPTCFFLLAAFFNLLCLSAAEFLYLKGFFEDQSYFRLCSLIYIMLFLLLAACVQCFPVRSLNSGDASFLFCLLGSGIGGYRYTVRTCHQNIRRLIEVFTVCWCCILTYRFFCVFDFSVAIKQAVLFCIGSVLITVTLILDRMCVVKIKGDKNVV